MNHGMSDQQIEDRDRARSLQHTEERTDYSAMSTGSGPTGNPEVDNLRPANTAPLPIATTSQNTPITDFTTTMPRLRGDVFDDTNYGSKKAQPVVGRRPTVPTVRGDFFEGSDSEISGKQASGVRDREPLP